MLLPLVLCGCLSGYNSRMELVPEGGVSSANLRAIQRETDIALAPMRFISVFQNNSSLRYGGKIAEWQSTTDRGLWYGEQTVTVVLTEEPNVAVIEINCDDAAGRKTVKEVQDVLRRMLEFKFPDVKVRLKTGYNFMETSP